MFSLTKILESDEERISMLNVLLPERGPKGVDSPSRKLKGNQDAFTINFHAASKSCLPIQCSTRGHASSKSSNTSLLEIWNSEDVRSNHSHRVRWVYKESMFSKDHIPILKKYKYIFIYVIMSFKRLVSNQSKIHLCSSLRN